MPAYALATTDIHEPARYQTEYLPTAAATLAAFGGRVLAAGSRQEQHEGSVLRSRNMILELPDLRAVVGFYNDPAYQAVVPTRQAFASTSLLAVEGNENRSTLGGAFVIATMDLVDGARFQSEYVPPTRALITRFGGRMLVGPGTAQPLEGVDFRAVTVVFEFASMQLATDWYHSPEYAPLIEVRNACTKGDLVIVSAE